MFPSLANMGTEERRRFIDGLRQEEKDLIRDSIRAGKNLQDIEQILRQFRQGEREALRIERNDRLNRLATPSAPRGRVSITRGRPSIPTLPPARTVQEIEQDQILNRITEGISRISSSEDEIPSPLNELRRRRRSLPVALPRGRVTVVRGGTTAARGSGQNQLNQPSLPTTSVRGQINILRGRGSSLPIPRNSPFGITPRTPDSNSNENILDEDRRRRRAEYMRDRRSTASEEQRQAEAIRSSQRRFHATPEAAEERRRLDIQRESNRRAAETIEQYEHRIQAQSERQQQRRREETEEQHAERIQAQAVRQDQRRRGETIEEYEDRTQADAARHQQRRTEETSDQYEARIQAQAARQEQARLMETPEQREARRVADETRQQQARANQTNQQRAVQNVARRFNAGRQRRANTEKAAFDGPGFVVPQPLDLGEMDVECLGCGALYFDGEAARRGDGTFNICCGNGRVNMALFENFSTFLKDLYEGRHPKSANFLENLREFNNSLAVASLNCKIKQPAGRGPQVFRVHGAVNHAIGSALPAPGQTPTYGQVYLLDTSDATDVRTSHPSNKKCDKALMEELGAYMSTSGNYDYAEAFEMLGRVYKEEEEKAKRLRQPMRDVRLLFHLDKGLDKRRFNFPVSNEVAAVYVTDADGNIPPCSYSVYAKSPTGQRALQTIYSTKPGLNSMLYPLLFPKMDHDWTTNLQSAQTAAQNQPQAHPNQPQDDEEDGAAPRRPRRITLMDFSSYLFARRNAFNPIHFARKLFHQLAVDLFIRIESQRLLFIRDNQSTLRTEARQNLADHVADGGEGLAGRRVILPASYTNSPRYMQQNYQDAMAIVTRFGKPDYFVTMTCNPAWKEITAHLKPDQTAFDAPDLTARVFHQKHATFMKDMTDRNIVGQVIAFIYVIEWQKRGLPHAHMLFTMAEEDKPDTPEKIDRVISAQLPDLDDPMDPRYNVFTAVAKHNLHRKCGPSSPCWDPTKHVCTKGFPKDFTDETTIKDSGFPSYHRPNNGVKATVQAGNKTETYDNSSVVPYNAFISVRYDCHCNWEISGHVASCKYVYKYCYKGSDQASVRVEGEAVDEIKEHINGRFICPPEACHRIFGFPVQGRSHAVIHLYVHTKDMEPITFETDKEAEALLRDRKTTLLAYFQLILDWRQKEADGADLGPVDPRTIYYHQLPEHFTFVKKDGIWKIKGRATKNIGRIFTVDPKKSELYALRLLLFHKKDCASYEELQTVNGVAHNTFASAAKAMGLLQGERFLRDAMQEAVITAMPSTLRGFFATLINFAEASPEEAQGVWDDYKDDLAADYFAVPTSPYAMAYYDILEMVDVDFRNLIPAPAPDRPNAEDDRRYDHVQEFEDRYAQLNDEQRFAVDSIVPPGDRELQGTKLALLDGPGGSGKTFVYETVYHKLRSMEKKVLCLAWTGIAASLLPYGRTICSIFKMNMDDDCRSSYLTPNSPEGKYLRQFDALILDECSMLSHWMLETMEEKLREVHNTTDVFGGKMILMGGDFRQILPIAPKHLRMDPVRMCMKESRLYYQFTKFPLRANMRVQGDELFWKDYLLSVGDGKEQEDEAGNITLPEEVISGGNLIEEIFEGVYDDPDALSRKAILCPTNAQVDKINDDILKEMRSEEKVFYSADTVIKEGDDALQFPIEYVNGLKVPSLPLHELWLKIGCVVMLLRNLAVKNGLCNGTRLQVVRFIRNYVLVCRFINGPRRGEEVYIPRIPLTSNNGLAFHLKRNQFPVKLAFAMTINKSQGQSLERVGVLLEQPVFGHGQLYVALSRGKSMEGVKVHIGGGSRTTKNIVEQSVL